ncbi:MAG: peptidylprolyl isomerase [Xanthomonadales bacterium]|nr:peptidylprolyl isomerase [Xanthomonadales bacterium]
MASLLLASACSRSPETLATTDAETITVTDLEAYLLTLPESERQLPAAGAASDAMESKIRRLALEKVLEASEQARELRASPEAVAYDLWLYTSALKSALLKAVAAELVPSEEAIRAKVAELSANQSNEPVLNFQHIYLRLDRASEPGEIDNIRARADAIAREAQAGADFHELVRQHSDSSDADGGGMVLNARPADLDENTREALLALEEYGISGVVESRTGLHILRLIRKLPPVAPSAAQLEATARNLLMQADYRVAQEKLVQDLRAGTDAQTDNTPWNIAGWSIDATTLEILLPEPADGRQQLVDHFLLAGEALKRGLDSPALKEELATTTRRQRLDRLFNDRRATFDEQIPMDRLRQYYDAQPALFSEPQKDHLDLIFIAQGDDPFTTQRRAEDLVAELRGGADFADAARRHSTGPGADNGGDLGPLAPAAAARLGPAIVAGLTDMEVGDISDPIYCTGRVMSHDPWMLRGGFAILRLRDRTEDQPMAFDQALPRVRRSYASDNRRELDRQLQDQILAEAGFKLHRVPEAGDFLR